MCPMSTKQTKAPKEKRRNSERRKEKSRDAARCRRGRETEIFTALAQALPLTSACCNTLDKASIMRLTISYLKARKVAELVPSRSLAVTGAADGEFLQALQGFLLVVSSDGDLVFLSENVSQHLGLSQMDMMGNSIFEFSHPCDHDELREVLGIAKSGNKASSKSVVQAESLQPQSFFLRMKCTLTTKGRNVNLKSASYKVIHCTGHILRKASIKEEKDVGGRGSNSKKENTAKEDPLQRCLVAIGEPIPHPANIEIPLDKQTFLSKHSLDMKFTYADDNIGEFLGYDPEDLIDRSFFEFHHALDHEIIHKGFKNLFAKGQSEIGRYRFLAQGGGYVWVLTQATLLHGGKAQQPISVVCVNFVISGVEAGDEVCSVNQLTAVKDDEPPPLLPPAAPAAVESKPKQPPSPTRSVAAPPPLPYPLPQPATSKIFMPRTEDMSKGFLTFSDDEPGLTLLKEEPEDLTHLAPMAGDVDIPLEGSSFLEDDVFNEFMMANYCPLDLMPAEDDADSASGSNCSPHDPFLTYRSDSSNHSSSDHKLDSPLPNSDRDSLPSLCSPDSDSNKLLEDDDELTFRAPYIPMGREDTELPFLISPDPIWCALSPSDRPPDASKSMQLSPGPSESSSKSCWSAQNSPPSLNSNLAQLLLGDGVKAESPTPMLQEEDKLSATLMSQLLQKVKIPNQGVRISCPSTPQKSKRQAQDFLSAEEPKRAKHSSELLQRLMAPKPANSWADEKMNKSSVLMNLLDDQPPPLEDVGYMDVDKGLPPLDVPPPMLARTSPDLMLSDVEAVLRYLNAE
ncbi:hypoxia-inducible factor 1-alpha-like isoform X2 [Neocloeon triangulifer]|uniref:hypoxia-inducible factor 1-alpha-like isoform X2 n=1 Tax=Neocloeon triangulifer TaxID=2078957 RepID=UPI00286F821F|nr:hypoxia-inducible factor 1-alpha-like isoform X2 [Neocloeon triangulifer]